MRKPQKEYKPSRGRILGWGIPLCLLFVIGVAATALSVWYRNTFSIPFKDLLYTLLSPLAGTGQTTIDLVLDAVLPATCVALVLAAGILIFFTVKFRRFRRLRCIGAGICAFAFAFGCTFTFFSLRMNEYVVDAVLNSPTFNPSQDPDNTFYGLYYADPDDVTYVAHEEPKNLICIYLESMETTYADRENGGNQAGINYIPNLTAFAKEHTSFSDSNRMGIGGFRSPDGTAWTMGALLATTAGIPFSLSVFGAESHNNLGNYDELFPGLITLGDILEKYDYNQEFLCGSDASFAGRDKYFSQHGGYEIFDLHTAREKGYIDPDYYVWWGFEDSILYQIAKDEVTRLAAMDEPFNLTMLTVDTHHVDGYICSQCQNEYHSVTGNVVSCADRQVAAFVEWCQSQPFYEDTVIVIMGDHPRMDTSLVKGVHESDRTMYNCFINADLVSQGRLYDRDMTSFDMFPTTLAALGFTIYGDRLGLGTNLFSETPTLAEEHSYAWLDREVGRYHDYYVDKFLNGKV